MTHMTSCVLIRIVTPKKVKQVIKRMPWLDQNMVK